MISSLSPLAITLAIILGVAILGALIALARNLCRFMGFTQIARDAERIAKSLGGEIFRDGGDLVTSGNMGRLPAVVRFSNKESVPGLNIRVGVPSTFTLWIAPRSAETTEGRTTLRTGDMIFDSRFVARSDDATQARMFLAMKQVPTCLRQLACSGNSFLALAESALELSELEIPTPATANHVLEHLRSIATLGAALSEMPGADTIVVKPIEKERRLLGRAAIIVGIVAAISLVVAASRPRATVPKTDAAAVEISGVPPAHASLIVGLSGWHTASSDDFDPNTLAWMRSKGATVSGLISGDFSGQGNDADAAYVLVRADGSRRVLIISNGAVRYDTRFPSLAVAARLRKSRVPGVEWNGPAPEPINGDGILMVRNADDPKSGLVIFLSGHRLASGVPVNYQSVPVD